MIEATCSTCGKTFQTYPSRVQKNKGQFCSRSCYAKELSKRLTGEGHFMFGRKHRPDTLAKMREIKQEHGKQSRGSNSPVWKGGRHKARGYVMIWVGLLSPAVRALVRPMIPRGHGYIPQHRLVMAKHLKRPLLRSEVVHHRNGIKDDNRLRNLELHGTATHKMEHWAVLKELKRLRRENECLRAKLRKATSL